MILGMRSAYPFRRWVDVVRQIILGILACMSSNGCGTTYVSQGEQPGKIVIAGMTDLYTEADRRFSTDPEAEPQVRALFALWDAHDPELVSIWEQTDNGLWKDCTDIQTLGVPFDHYY